MAERWSPGDCVVLRAVGPLTVGKPAVVVEDSTERVMLYVAHGSAGWDRQRRQPTAWR